MFLMNAYFYIKTTSNQFIEIYEKLFNLILDTGFIPENWVVGNIIPIYKNKGDSNDPKNFRPITLVRDRPFNLKGGGGGGLWIFCFVQNFFFEQHKS